MKAISVIPNLFEKEREAMEEMREMTERPWRRFPEAAPKIPGSGVGFAVGYARKPAVGAKTKTVRVKQEYIDFLLARAPRRPFPVVPDATFRLLSPEVQEGLLSAQEIAAAITAARDEDEGILEQYRAKGYAEVEVEDDEDGVDDMGN